MKEIGRICLTAAFVLTLEGLASTADAACSLRFTSPGDGATVRTAGITAYGQGGADAQHGDYGTVTAKLNGTTIFNHSGSFTAAVSFMESRGVPVTLRPGLNYFSVSGSVGGCGASDSMTVLYDLEVDQGKNKGEPEDDLSCDTPSPRQGNPLNIAIGNKFQREEDFRGAGPYPLRFARHYNSVDGYWRHNYSTRLRLTSASATLIRADGRESVFAISGSTITPTPTERGTLAQTSTGWRYTSPQQETFDFDAQGRLTQVADLNGHYHSLTHSSTDVVVSDAFGNQLTFIEDDRYQPLTLITPDLSFSYFYDATARLTTVTTVADGQTLERTFHYENPTYPRFLTGITDERGVRYVSWEYDSLGRAIKSVYADSADQTTVTYNSDGSTTVTNALGRAATYRFAVIDGVKRITAIEGAPTPWPGRPSTATTPRTS